LKTPTSNVLSSSLRKNLHWSSAVYPTQAKKRLEWGTQPLLPVHRKFEVATTRQLSHPLPVPAAKGGCPIQAVFWLEWDKQHSTSGGFSAIC
jgi:hypothetical protein